ncbi:MAG: hypothetical protein JWR01_376 [Subtercola sp.]|nr:hypothetical protein [Subtercola sp.]
MTEWHARFERDARFRQAVEAEYDGAYDVGDALWWLDHPAADAPSGEPSPRRMLTGLQRAAFARPSGAGEEARAVAARGELETIGAALESERAEAERAVDEALSALDARPAVRRRTTVLLAGAFIAVGCLAGAAVFVATTMIASESAGGSTSAGTDASSGAGSGAGTTADGDGAGNSASSGSAGSAGSGTDGAPGDNGDNAADSAADGAGTAAVDGGSSYNATGGTSATAAPRLTAAPYPNFPPGVGADSYAAIFSHGQLVADLPPSEPAGELLVSTFRALNIGQNSPGAVYAAVNTANQVCLVVYGNPVDYGYTCDNVDRVSTRGLQVSLATRDHRDPVSGLVTPGVGLSARWLPDGALTLDSSVPYDRD